VIQGRWFISPHAVRRCIERIHPRYTYEQARDWLIKASQSAHYIRPSSQGRGEIWRAGRQFKRIRMMVEHYPGRELPTLCTVLTGNDLEAQPGRARPKSA
jgi:hypothetical protein